MKIADEYFNNCRMIAVKNPEIMNKVVRYKVFAREAGVVVGANRSVNLIKEQTYGPVRVFGLNDGEEFSSGEIVLMIEGNFYELVNLETTYLGFLSFSGGVKSMHEIVTEADGVPVIDMSARHFPWQLIEETALAAYLGGATGTSTKAGYEYVQKWYNPGDKFKLYASLPHAMAAVAAEMAEDKGCWYPSVMAAKLFQQTFPGKPITLLADYEGRELDVVKQAFDIFGDKLFAVRLDTHGGRQMQGTHPFKKVSDESVIENYFKKKTGKTLSKIVSEFGGSHTVLKTWPYFAGNGVTVESVYVMREFLDSIGAKHVKIVVSSGFNKEKVAAFRMAGAPMDFIGTGSWLKFMMFTADITDVVEKGKWIHRTKVGRNHGGAERAKLLFERV